MIWNTFRLWVWWLVLRCLVKHPCTPANTPANTPAGSSYSCFEWLMINYWLNTGCSLIGNLLNQCRIQLNSVSVFSSVNLSIGLARWRKGVSFRWVDLERRPVLENIFRVQSYEISKPHFHLFGRKCHFLALFGTFWSIVSLIGTFWSKVSLNGRKCHFLALFGTYWHFLVESVT